MPTDKGVMRAPEWTEDEFRTLAELVIDTVKNGGSVVEACEEFERRSGGLRSAGSSRFKWQTKLSEKYADAYAQAKEMGRIALAQQAKEQRDHVRSIKPQRVVSLRPANRNAQSDADTTPTVTQRELIKYLRDIRIVSDDESVLRVQLDQSQAQLADVTRERDNLRNQVTLLQSKFDELKAEYATVEAALNIVRRHATGVENAEPQRYVIGKGGVIERVAD